MCSWYFHGTKFSISTYVVLECTYVCLRTNLLLVQMVSNIWNVYAGCFICLSLLCMLRSVWQLNIIYLFIVCVSYHDFSIHLNCLIANGCKWTYLCVCPTGPISFDFWQFQIIIMGSDSIFDMTWKCLGRLNRHRNKTPDLQLLRNLIFSHVKILKFTRTTTFEQFIIYQCRDKKKQTNGSETLRVHSLGKPGTIVQKDSN